MNASIRRENSESFDYISKGASNDLVYEYSLLGFGFDHNSEAKVYEIVGELRLNSFNRWRSKRVTIEQGDCATLSVSVVKKIERKKNELTKDYEERKKNELMHIYGLMKNKLEQEKDKMSECRKILPFKIRNLSGFPNINFVILPYILHYKHNYDIFDEIKRVFQDMRSFLTNYSLDDLNLMVVVNMVDNFDYERLYMPHYIKFLESTKNSLIFMTAGDEITETINILESKYKNAKNYDQKINCEDEFIRLFKQETSTNLSFLNGSSEDNSGFETLEFSVARKKYLNKGEN